MAVKPPSSSVQYVTHANQLRPSRGANAVLVAEDGDAMALTYDPSIAKWIGEKRSFANAFHQIAEGYMNTTYQGGDTAETVYAWLTASNLVNINQPDYGDGWLDGFEIESGLVSEIDYRMELKKWVKAGLHFQGRITTSQMAEANSASATLYMGPGFRSADYAFYPLSGTQDYGIDIDHRNYWWESTMRGSVTSYGAFAADFAQIGYNRGPWITYNDFAPRVFPLLMTQTGSASDASSYNVELLAQYNGQVLLMGVLTVREDGTTPTTPTIINSDFTWVQVAETAFDVTGNMRGKLTVFRAQCDTDNYYGGFDIDYGGVTQNGYQVCILGMHNENRGGTNGSAAIAQSATGTSASDADVSASLSAFADADNITIAFVGMTREAGFPAINALTGWSDMIYDGYDTGAYYSYLAAAWYYGNDTTPSMDLLSHDAAGMVAIEVAAATVMDEPFIGTHGVPGIGGYVTGSGAIAVTVADLEMRYVA